VWTAASDGLGPRAPSKRWGSAIASTIDRTSSQGESASAWPSRAQW